jgi:hypothetical protein
VPKRGVASEIVADLEFRLVTIWCQRERDDSSCLLVIGDTGQGAPVVVAQNLLGLIGEDGAAIVIRTALKATRERERASRLPRRFDVSTAILEILGCFTFWLWLRRGASPAIAALGFYHEFDRRASLHAETRGSSASS